MYLLMYLFLVFLIPLYESIFLSAKFHSFSAWRTYFNISYSAGVLVMYSCSFCISERVLLLFLKDIFAEYRILGWWFFSFFSFKDIALLSSSVQFSHSVVSDSLWPRESSMPVETVSVFIFGGCKITADGDCSHEIKRLLLLGRKVMTNLDSIFFNM